MSESGDRHAPAAGRASDYRFGPFRLDTAGFRLLRDGTPLPLSPKALDLLFLLAGRPHTLVSKDELQQALWPDVAVTDNTLTQLVSDVRRALGDSPSAPRYVQTVARRGYRFVGAVEVVPGHRRPTPPELAFLHFPTPSDQEPPGGPPARIGARETSNLDAHRALTEGRLKLEAMDPALVPAAMADFNRAIALDPRYTVAYVGRAHARFWRYEASRAQNRPEIAELRAAVADIRRAIELDADLAEAHAALALFLTAANQPASAVEAGRRAVALDAANWRHWFRLGVAAWGDERVRCLARVLEQYPEFPYTYFAMAMVHVARDSLAQAEAELRRGLDRQGDPTRHAGRFPGRGLHWLLGLTRLAGGDAEGAHTAFDRELESTGGELYATEYVMDAYDGHGFAFLRTGALEAAARMFGRALEVVPDHARSLAGLAEANRRSGRTDASSAALERGWRAVADLRAGGRTSEALMATAQLHAVAGSPTDAVSALGDLFSDALPGFAGWTIPIEPLLASMQDDRRFEAVLQRLAERAR